MASTGIVNTADDDQELETIRIPGKDGEFDTGDDETRSLAAFQRSITVSDVMIDAATVDPDIRQVDVEILCRPGIPMDRVDGFPGVPLQLSSGSFPGWSNHDDHE